MIFPLLVNVVGLFSETISFIFIEAFNLVTGFKHRTRSNEVSDKRTGNRNKTQ